MELTRENVRAMIYHNFRRGLSEQECIDQLTPTFGDTNPSFTTVKHCYWYNDFNRGCSSLTQFERSLRNSGRSSKFSCSVVLTENIDVLQKLILVMQDRHVTYCEIEALINSRH
ncbi:uncharacterized protein LOC119688429 [Teleopsis dalmanni]|uniref:uncharacterized protein LOC119688429 n=1 Tax=Teleopsis dalmanni TaxID=139649 RepID=UPI0018CFD369|nr:uncharacterized protein LOC119688429 [Teleopsis dalmanni]